MYVEISSSPAIATTLEAVYDGGSGQQNATNILTKQDILTLSGTL